ncbi:Hypothetical protein D9617_4g004350 [Elsinoe fawcettii]|nr:Hypothetical protein D9617_4g004350 [Elsinoe fawcettii]
MDLFTLSSPSGEWEYEYDYENPEVFYITADFSTHAPPGLPGKKLADGLAANDTRKSQSNNARKPRKRRKKESDAQDATQIDTPTPETPIPSASHGIDQGTPATPPPRPDYSFTQPTTSALVQEPDQDTDPAGPKTIQILDLHTRNPLITYGPQFYTCHWATDIGTSLYLAPSTDDPPSQPLLRSFSTFDILAKTRARLVAVPASLKPAVPPAPRPAPEDPDGNDYVIDTVEGDRVLLAPDGSMKIHVPQDASEGKKAQARFLEKWGELKAKKGWKDPIPVKAVRQYRVPENWEEVRREWAEVEKAQADRGVVVGKGSAKARRRRRMRGKEMGVGEDEDEDGDEEGADQRESVVVPDDVDGDAEEDDDEDDDDDEIEHAGVAGDDGQEWKGEYEENPVMPGAGVIRFQAFHGV